MAKIILKVVCKNKCPVTGKKRLKKSKGGSAIPNVRPTSKATNPIKYGIDLGINK